MSFITHIAKRAHRSEKSIALDVLAILKPYLPIGEPLPVVSEGPPPIPWLRQWILSDTSLWRDDILSMPSLDAIRTIILRAGTGFTIDFRYAFHLSRRAASSRIINALFVPGSDVFALIASRAEAIIWSSMPTALNYGISTMFWSACEGCVFENLLTLDMYASSSARIPPLRAPAMRNFSIHGVRAVASEIIPAWRGAATIPFSSLTGTILHSTQLRNVSLKGVSVPLDTPCDPVPRNLVKVAFHMRKPESAECALLSYFAPEMTATVVVCRPAYSDALPDWMWRCSAIGPTVPLALVAEGSQSMMWLTIMPLDELSSSLKPVFSDDIDPHGISLPRPDRPTLVVRHHRISRMYIPANGLPYASRLLADVKSIHLRVRTFVAREIQIQASGHRVWLLPSTHAATVLPVLTKLLRVVIQDERLNLLLRVLPKSCLRLDYWCRPDWYGKSGLGGVRSALRDVDKGLGIHLMGVTREVDAQAVSSLLHTTSHPGRSLTLVDERAPMANQVALSPLARRINVQRDTVFYYEMKSLALEAEIAMLKDQAH
ncbi:hypothetical protein PENSPDRAFT_669263 [Peniophora sp. CONT]|nr:hypothetical protein PENSPDRAFT_669263 [Peniophora sp. CONT]